MSKAFEGLVQKRFDGDEHLARQYVGDLGRASYFDLLGLKPGMAISILRKWEPYVPHIFIREKDQIVAINWQHRRMKRQQRQAQRLAQQMQ